MATTVHEAHKISLIDGTEITLRPLKISLLRKFMKKFEGIAGVVDDNDKSTVLTNSKSVTMFSDSFDLLVE